MTFWYYVALKQYDTNEEFGLMTQFLKAQMVKTWETMVDRDNGNAQADRKICQKTKTGAG